MKICFGFMFCGVLLLAFDFKFGPYDLVPNFVGGLGYAAVAIGTGGLAPMTGNFVAACSFGWLLFFAVVGRPYVPSDAQMPFGALMTVLNCAMMWTTLSGVRDIAVGRGRPQLVERVARLQWAYVAVVIFTWLVGEFVPMPTNAARVSAVAIFAAAVAVMVMILRLLYQAWKKLSP
jgi:hypothetical protein